MIKKVFEKLISNVNDFNDEELKYLNPFIKDGIVVKNEDGNLELSSKYKVCLVKVEKNFVVLEDLISEHKNIKIEFDKLNGAYDGDLVLAKRIFNPRSRIKANIIYFNC